MTETRIEGYRGLGARAIEIVIGAILLLAGILKAWQPLDFIQQIADYKIVSAPLPIKIAAWAMIAVECGLGMALIAGYRRKWTLPATAALLVAFLVLLGWAWHTGATEDCGCFGSWLKRTPAEAFAEDFVMLLAIGSAWYLSRHEPVRFRSARIALVNAAVVASLALTGMSSTSERQSSDPTVRLKSQGGGVNIIQGVDIQGIAENTAAGWKTLVLMDTGCTHCQQSVPALNDLGSTISGYSPLIALCSNSEAEVEMFRNKYGSRFPIGRVKYDDFMRLFERGKTPRIILLYDGSPVKIWDGAVPAREEIDSILKR